MKKRLASLFTALVLIVQSILPTDIISGLGGLMVTGAGAYAGIDSNCVSSLDVTVDGNTGESEAKVEINVNVIPDNDAIKNSEVGVVDGVHQNVDWFRAQVKTTFENEHPGRTWPLGIKDLQEGDWNTIIDIVKSIVDKYNLHLPKISTTLKIKKNVREYYGDEPAEESVMGELKLPNGTYDIYDKGHNKNGSYEIKEYDDYYEIEVQLDSETLFWISEQFGFDFSAEVSGAADNVNKWHAKIPDGSADAEVVIEAHYPEKDPEPKYEVSKSGSSNGNFGVSFDVNVTAPDGKTLKNGKFVDKNTKFTKEWWTDGVQNKSEYLKLYSVKLPNGEEISAESLSKYIDENGEFTYDFGDTNDTKADFKFYYTYTEDYIKESLVANKDNGGAVNGSYSNFGQPMTGVTNEADFTPENDDKPVQSWGNGTLPNPTPVTKTGSVDPTNPQVFNWTIVIDVENFNMENPVLNDTFSGQKFADDATITVNGKAVKPDVTADGFKLDLSDYADDAVDGKIVITYSTVGVPNAEGKVEPVNTADVSFDSISVTTPDKETHTFDKGVLDGISDTAELTASEIHPATKEGKGYDPKTQLFTWDFSFNETGSKYDYIVLTDTPDGYQIFPEDLYGSDKSIYVKAIQITDTSKASDLTLSYKGNKIPDTITEKDQGYYLNDKRTELTIVLWGITGENYYTYSLKTKLVDYDYLGGNYDIDEHYFADPNATEYDYQGTKFYGDKSGDYTYTPDDYIPKKNYKNSVLVTTPDDKTASVEAEQPANTALLWKGMRGKNGTEAAYGDINNIQEYNNTESFNGYIGYIIKINPYGYDITEPKLVEELPIGTELASIERVVIAKTKDDIWADHKDFVGEDNIKSNSGLSWAIESGAASFNGSKTLYRSDKIVFDLPDTITEYYEIYLLLKLDENFADDILSTGEKVELKNYADFTGKIGGKPFDHRQGTSGMLKFNEMTKSGSVSGDNTIKWEAFINRDLKDIGGMTIVDELDGTGLNMVLGDRFGDGMDLKIERVDTSYATGTFTTSYEDVTSKFTKRKVDYTGFEVTVPEEYGNDCLRLTFYTSLTEEGKKNLDTKNTFTNKLHLDIEGVEIDDSEVESNVVNGSTLQYKSWAGAGGTRDINLYKVDENDKPLAGAEFTLSYTDPNGVSKSIPKLTDSDADVETGKIVFTSLVTDTIIEIRETKAPENYALSSQVWYVVFLEKLTKEWFKENNPDIYDSIIFADTIDSVEFTAKNVPKGEDVTLYKTWDGIALDNFDTSEETREAFLDHTVFKLRDSGTGKVVKYVKPVYDEESKKAKLTFTDLESGKTYTIEEGRTADGYLLFTGKITVTVDASGDVTLTKDGEPFKNGGTIVNQKEKLTDISFTKEYINGGKAVTGDELNTLAAATEFTLFSDADCTKKSAEAQHPVVKDGKAVVTFTGLKDGTYYIKETLHPTTYEDNTTVYVCKIENGKATFAVYSGDPSASAKFEDTLTVKNTAKTTPTGKFSFTKSYTDDGTEVTSKALADATEFTLYNEAGEKVTSVPPSFADGKATVTFAGLNANSTYTIKETAPDGYNKCKDIIVKVDAEANVTATPDVITNGVENTKIYGKATVNKWFNAVGPTIFTGNQAYNKNYGDDSVMKGTEFTLVNKNDITVAKQDESFGLFIEDIADGAAYVTKPLEKRSDGRYYVDFDHLVPGEEYYIFESKQPEGFARAAEVVDVKVSDDGSVKYHVYKSYDEILNYKALNGDKDPVFSSDAPLIENAKLGFSLVKYYDDMLPASKGDVTAEKLKELEALVEGTIFTLKDAKGNLVARVHPHLDVRYDGEKATYYAEIWIYDGQTDIGGRTVKLSAGTKPKFGGLSDTDSYALYTLTEETAPEGYKAAEPIVLLLNSALVSVMPDQNFMIDEELNILKIVNERVYTANDIFLYKEYEEIDLVKMDATLRDTLLGGTEFTLYDGTDPIVSAKPVWDNLIEKAVVRFSDGMTVGSGTLKLELDKTYTVKETKVPDGYDDKRTTDYTVKISDTGEVTYAVADSTSFSAEVPGVQNYKKIYNPGEIQLIKTYQDTKLSKLSVADRNALLEGTKFTLYKDKELEVPVTSASPVWDGTRALVTFDKSKISVGNVYYIKEDSAPEGYGYTISDEVIVVNIDNEGVVTYRFSDEKDFAPETKTIENAMIYTAGEIELQKAYVDGEMPVPMTDEMRTDTIFGLYKGNDTTVQPVKTVSPDESGKIVFDGLELKTSYTVIETKAPAGFAKSDKVYTVKVDEKGNVTYYIGDEQTTDLTIDNEKLHPSDIEVIKTFDDTDLTKFSDEELEALLNSTKFTLYKVVNGDKVQKTAKSPVFDGTTAKVTFTEEDGIELDSDYIVKETATDARYELNETEVKFHVDKLGVVTSDGKAYTPEVINSKVTSDTPDNPDNPPSVPTETTQATTPTDPTPSDKPNVPTDTTTEEQTTAPETTTTIGQSTAPDETTAPEETTVPEETTAPEETTVSEETTAPEETTVPEETTAPETTTAPEEEKPQDNNPITGVALAGGTVAFGAFVAMAVSPLIKKRKKK